MCDQASGQRGEWESGSHLLLRIMALASRVAALENGAGWGEGEGTRMARPLRIEYERACHHALRDMAERVGGITIGSPSTIKRKVASGNSPANAGGSFALASG